MIQTERLLLRRPTAADVEDPPAFLTDPGVMAFLGGVGEGYATEAAAAVRDWFRRPGLISLIAPRNSRSQRVAERLGATSGETVELPDNGLHVVWVHPR